MIRKRCKHAAGLTGAAKRKAWRSCRCAWGVDLYVQGVRVWHNLGGDERSARVQELRMRADLAEDRPVKRAPGVGFRDMAEDWYAAKKASPKARPGSIASYRSRIDHAARYLGDIPIPEIKQSHVRGLAETITRDLSVAMTRNVLAVVSAVIGHAATQGIVRPSIDFGSLAPANDPKIRKLSVDEVQAAIAALEEPVRGMAEVALLTGLRRGELLAATVDDALGDRLNVDENVAVDGSIGPPKTATSVRVVTLSRRAQAIIRARTLEVSSGRLWPFTISYVDNALRAAMKAAGVYRKGQCWHSLRHAHTAILNEAGMGLRDSAARLGHGSHYAQSLAYGWAAEQASADHVDAVVKRHAKTSTRKAKPRGSHKGDPGAAGPVPRNQPRRPSSGG